MAAAAISAAPVRGTPRVRALQRRLSAMASLRARIIDTVLALGTIGRQRRARKKR